MQSCLQGPRDNNSFRSNVTYAANDDSITISEKSITYEGILNEYSYGIGEELEYLFNTTYSCAIAKSLESNDWEHYLVLEMKSKLDGEGLYKHGGRPPMSFVFVLDISGSMHSSFDKGDRSKTKLEVAKECLINLLSKLQPKDKFGLILFDDQAIVHTPLNYVESLNLSQVKSEILKIKTRGGTIIKSGMDAAEKMLKDDRTAAGATTTKEKGSDNRIFFLTDMNPTDDSSCNLVDVGHKLSADKIYISLIGIGVDFNSDLAYQFALVKGCNSFTVSSAEQFRKQMSEDFDYTSLMICYNVSLKFQSSEFDVDEIYGSPATPDRSIGEVLKIDSICPSPKSSEEGGIKGGVVVLKLKRKVPEHTCGDKLSLELTYRDWEEKDNRQTDVFDFPDDPANSEPYFQNSSARKAVALVRYVKQIKAVLSDQKNYEKNKPRLDTLKAYLVEEIKARADSSMEKEVLMIDSITTQIEKLKGKN